jgi:hypothetical protein
VEQGKPYKYDTKDRAPRRGSLSEIGQPEMYSENDDEQHSTYSLE